MHKRMSPHGDFDHLGYSYDLVNNFRVKNVVFNHGEYNGLEKKLINLLEEKNIKYYQNLEELNIDNNKLYF